MGARAERAAAGIVPNRNGAVTSAVLGAPTRGTGPLRLALAGATRSGSAGVGSPSSRSAGEATPHSSGVNCERQLILGWRLSPNRDIAAAALLIVSRLALTAAPITAAGRFSPFGPRGMSSSSPDNSFRFFEDFYAVPSTASESNDGCLLYFVPKNGGRIFDIHKNSCLFISVHLTQFIFASCFALSIPRELGGRDRPSRANRFKLRHYPKFPLARHAREVRDRLFVEDRRQGRTRDRTGIVYRTRLMLLSSSTWCVGAERGPTIA